MKTGLFFGSFNPVHCGHLIIAEYFATHTDLEEIWFVVSPHNPLKEQTGLIDANHRLNMVELAIMNNNHFKVCDIEFQLSTPSYTVDTLNSLKKKYPLTEFIVIIGSDSLAKLDQWKDYKKLLEYFQFFVYPRKRSNKVKTFENHPSVKFYEAPEVDISSTYIRESLKLQKSIKYLTPDVVINYLGTISNS
jgi:nicotinate-nucleotide adenylyltransferase